MTLTIALVLCQVGLAALGGSLATFDFTNALGLITQAGTAFLVAAGGFSLVPGPRSDSRI